jgi:hypothetical protein
MKDMDIFHYDKNDTHDSNFNRWWAMNSLEREMYKEKRLSHEEAERLFNSMFGRYRSTQTDT